uniref:HTH cro/C1-type domain-containing protein n=1 Tax=Chloropicon laureae TaxID=464258 RepID=A0A7S2YVV3_9CHLO|mmetsp:Transcript_11097/g.28510  ORF Transcript_11097/g.28510 Transcript_11097/m.28510 type:complete len:144 (+) Transcript_11097:141-572(+)|eukprot:CAMPEP_0197487368 /NCGR_PEP_ID=MMETSP1311-20131121/2380_1 /TAXON_ID=464262 /ORGANISM="Genus nov. species nov., Strain RCC856" /LENGTH=143 /DNA_ID=CAMNT_0043030989 /DNA_START=97 /DNA_END=528 /DNA_ORIENTATION=+
MNMQGGQDFDTVIIRKKKPTSSQTRDSKNVNNAFRTGNVATTTKFGAGGNSKGGPANATKLDNSDEAFAHAKVSTELKKAIQQARIAKKMTQAQLAQAINELPKVVQSYENGKAIPNNQVLGKIERALGCKLRGGGKKKGGKK